MSAERTQPHSVEAERSVLGALLIRPAALDDLGDLRVDDFFLPIHRETFEAMRAVVKRGRPLDVIELADELKVRGMAARFEGGVDGYLLACANAVPTAEQVGHYARIVREKATLRRLIAACADVQSSAYGDFGEFKVFLDEARAKIASVELDDADDQPLPIGDGMNDTLDDVQTRANNPSSYFITTGHRSVDEKIGGYRGGQLIVVAGRPGKGKSAYAKDVHCHLAAVGVPSLAFSFEMSRMEIQERVLSREAKVNGRKIVTGRLEIDDWKKLPPAAARIREWPFYVYTKSVTAERLCSIARRWYRRLPAPPEGQTRRAVISVDYLSLIELEHEGDNYARALGQVTRMLKKLASELDIPVMLLCQLNRAIEKEKTQREPILSDLRDAGAIEQDANMVLFPWWEGEAPRDGAKDAYIIVGKNRSGPIGRCEVSWIPALTTFVDRDNSAYTLFDRSGETGRASYVDTD